MKKKKLTILVLLIISLCLIITPIYRTAKLLWFWSTWAEFDTIYNIEVAWELITIILLILVVVVIIFAIVFLIKTDISNAISNLKYEAIKHKQDKLNKKQVAKLAKAHKTIEELEEKTEE